jgi:hypothetical protein
LVKIEFNPANRKVMSLFYKNSIDIYEIKETVELNESGIINGMIMNLKHSIEAVRLDSCVWDEIGNVWIIKYRSTYQERTNYG